MTTASESVLRSGGSVEMAKYASNNEAEMGSGDTNTRPVNGSVSVALVEDVNLPIAEKQTAERIKLDDSGSKRCCCSVM